MTHNHTVILITRPGKVPLEKQIPQNYSRAEEMKFLEELERSYPDGIITLMYLTVIEDQLGIDVRSMLEMRHLQTASQTTA